MYLKTLILKGFKSFADRSVLNLEPGITAVVGPNGSGKSNISDAVLWVLGERNAKHLRGNAMEDVIFAGSSARRATSMAEVDLVLDNSDGTLPVDYSEVVITRRMYRTGESEYLINGTIARRMDVLDILHDTGLGSGTHSIISQGSLDSVLQSKAEDRRALVEEAAGVLKHKQRLAKSQRKLEKMANHVARVADVVGEVGRQLGPLERKAKRARTYEELSAELAQVKLILSVDDLRKLQTAHASALEAEHAQEVLVAKQREQIEQTEAELETLQERMKSETEDAGELSRRYRAASSALERIDSTIMRIRDRRRAAFERATEIEMGLEASRAAMVNADSELIEARRAYDEAKAQKESADASVVEIEGLLKDAEEQRAALAQQSRALVADTERMTEELTALREKKAQTQEVLTNGLAHIKVLDGHTAELELQVKRAAVDAKSAELEASSMDDALAALREQESSARNLVGFCTQAREAARAALDEARTSQQSLEAQIAALEEIERNAQSSDDELRSLIEQTAQERGIDLKVLSHCIEVDPEMDRLVEHLLGEDISALVVDDESSLRSICAGCADKQYIGREVLVLETDSAPVSQLLEEIDAHHTSTRPLISYITAPQVYKRAVSALLGDVRVCDTFEEALSAHLHDDKGYRFATKDGAVIWPSGKVSIGMSAGEDTEGVLARLRRLSDLKDALSEAQTGLAKAHSEAQDAEESLRKAQNESLDLSEKLAVLKGNAQSARSVAEKAAEKLSSATRELEDAQTKRKEAQKAVEQARPDVEGMEQAIQKLQDELAVSREKHEEVEQLLAPKVEDAQRLGVRLNEAKLNAAKLSERVTYSSRVIDRHLSDLEEMQQRDAEARELLQIKRVSAERLEPLIKLFERLSDSARRHALVLEDEANAAQSSTEGLHGKMGTLRDAAHAAHAAYDELNETLSSLRVEKARLEMQVEAAVAAIVEECGVPLDRALAEPQLEDRAHAEEEAFRLNRRIANLGTINPDAAHEYDELKQRYDYLSAQLSDLDSAARSLRRIDRIIEARMKDDFIRTFEEVNASFQEIFESLFPGGTAHLVLENPEDLENTGVEVNAQPAGKRITKMSLMSGGEKSLTALALLFALYRTRATPFYILDEVEAALDDTNLRRLVSFIDSMRSSTQLIMITHQRRTMETADVLFGVSMQADGVTKVISQKLEAVDVHN